MSDFLFEKLAEVAHLIWARWAMYAEEHNDAEHRQRWRIQARTLYADLSESEKESDREIARQWIAAMGIGQSAEVWVLQARVSELEPDAKLGRMVRAAKEAVLDYEMPFHQCTCCGGGKEYDAAHFRYVSRHTPDCPWAALVKEIEAPEAARKEGG